MACCTFVLSGPTNVNSIEEHKPMPSQARHTISLFRTIALIAVTALLIASAALPVAAQNSVPASAVEAAKKPEVAAKLAHPTQPAGVSGRSQDGYGRPGAPSRPDGRHRLRQRSHQRHGRCLDHQLRLCRDRLLHPRFGDNITGFQFGAWAYPGDTPQAVNFSDRHYTLRRNPDPRWCFVSISL